MRCQTVSQRARSPVDCNPTYTRQQPSSPAHRQCRHARRHPIDPVSQGPDPARRQPLQEPQSDRTLLQQAQTLQALRNTLRPKSCPFPSFHPARMRYDLDALNVDSASPVGRRRHARRDCAQGTARPRACRQLGSQFDLVRGLRPGTPPQRQKDHEYYTAPSRRKLLVVGIKEFAVRFWEEKSPAGRAGLEVDLEDRPNPSLRRPESPWNVNRYHIREPPSGH